MKILERIVLMGALALGCDNVDNQEKGFEVSNLPSGVYTKNTDNFGILQVNARFPRALKSASYFVDGREYKMDIRERDGRGEAVAREYLSPNFLDEGRHEVRLRGVTVDDKIYEERSEFNVDNTNPRIRVKRENGRLNIRIEDNFPGLKYSLFAVREGESNGEGNGEKRKIRKIEDYEILRKKETGVEINLNIDRLADDESLLVLVSDSAGNMGKHEEG